jgi:hypothetical protein
LSSSVFGFPIVAPSITLTDAAGLVTDAVTADTVTADIKVVTPLVTPAAPTAGTGAAGTDLQIVAAAGATSATLAGGAGGDLELFAGNAGDGVGAANGGSVILKPGSGDGVGASGLVRVEGGPLLTSGALVDLGAGTPVALTVGNLRAGLLSGTPGALATYNLPSAATIIQGFPGIKVGDVIRFSVANLSGANAINMGGAAAAVGGIQIAANQSGAFALIATNVSAGTEAFTLYRISS